MVLGGKGPLTGLDKTLPIIVFTVEGARYLAFRKGELPSSRRVEMFEMRLRLVRL